MKKAETETASNKQEKFDFKEVIKVIIGRGTPYYSKEDVFAGIKEDKASGLGVPVWFTMDEWDWVKMAYQYINGTVSDSKLLGKITKKYNQMFTELHNSPGGYVKGCTKNIDSVMHYVLEQVRNFDQNKAKYDVCNVDPSVIRCDQSSNDINDINKSRPSWNSPQS